MTVLVADVAVPLPLPHPFSYVIPEDLRKRAVPGMRVRVPFGPRQLVGYVVAVETREDGEGLKAIRSVVDDEPLVGPVLIDLSRKIATRYFCGPGEVLAAMLPSGVRHSARTRRTAIVRPVKDVAESYLARHRDRKSARARRAVIEALLAEPKGIPRRALESRLGVSPSPINTLLAKGVVEIEHREEREDPFARLDTTATTAPTPTSDQKSAMEAITAALDGDAAKTFLLHGVTGSGKTEVYLSALAACLEMGKGAIVLVPEISLTPQTVERFQARFGEVAVLHSRLGDSERAAQWRDIKSGKKRIAIGPRSAIFAPVTPLGLVIIDEEHENTFKQQNSPRYHARAVALMRAEAEGAVVVLGSATPSLEAWEAARRGRIHLLSMPRRVSRRPLPKVSLIDMRVQKPRGPGGVFSPLLASLIGRALDRKEQTLLFLNRRGYHTTILCTGCEEPLTCRDCDIPMTFYKAPGHLLCHYCGRTSAPPARCPACGHTCIRFTGFGTELVEHAARSLFPHARVARMDSEAMKARDAHVDLFSKIRSLEIDILVGTQMAAKGLDFPGITLIGVVAADTSLLIPDFRSAERTFQLVTQVAGRSGRGAKEGRVLVQTYSPDHYAYQAALEHDYEGFARQELVHRREAGYPPFGSLLRIVVQGEDERAVRDRSGAIAEALGLGAAELGITLLGPSPCPLSRIKRLFRYHLVFRAHRGRDLEALIPRGDRLFNATKTIQVLIDRDPTSMM